MEVKTRKEIIEQTITTYVASDGTEFTNEIDCLKYEKECEKREKEKIKKERIALAEKLRVKPLDNVLPINTDGYTSDNNGYAWYRLKNKTDFYTVVNAYTHTVEMEVPASYPTMICIEAISPYNEEDYEELDLYGYDLNDLIKITKDFFEIFGCKTTIEPNKSNVLMGGNEE